MAGEDRGDERAFWTHPEVPASTSNQSDVKMQILLKIKPSVPWEKSEMDCFVT
jgi:hypothetical protein